MTEDDARAWLAERFEPERFALLERFVALLRAEAEHQSLIARSTFKMIWARHIVDSAQLLAFTPADGTWLDVGSGGGLPGLVIAILRDGPIVLSEPRRKRADFLRDAVADLGLTNATIQLGKTQNVEGKFSIVTARAVAPIDDILRWTQPVVSRETLYVLQRGRNWQEDVALARHAWHGAFHVEHSITDPDAGIVLARDVTPR